MKSNCLFIKVLIFSTIIIAIITLNGKVSAQSVKVFQNMRYAEKPKGFEQDTSSDRLLDLYLPQVENNKSYPVLVFIHGGGFAGGDKNAKGNVLLCQKIAEKGYAVVSINYYLYLRQHKIAGASAGVNMKDAVPADGKFHPGLETAVKHAAADTEMALQWIKDNATTYKLDANRVAISGGSAGAMTALYTAYQSKQQILPIRCVVNLWGGLANTDGVNASSPAVLTFHGDQDEIINVAYAKALHQKMTAVGSSTSEMHILQNMGHAIYNYIIKSEINRIDEFLQKCMGIKPDA
ncbi:carboxylesterase family protein [Sphingobacterium sp. DK4209]|uniref:Carboxylesterase family protein n=1 Tax=Sphingobacterium zhuxiongii TaxID=2662364 RepID=A0A5Q0Q874_9SPHI|nr:MULTISPECIES: alpha/beta hydrolase [unclassified Sphingobacterium]MVZ64236.1 carboxylesterase family protein [Sphingobacterium sp. DK4209]QGA25586.1 carboxylesterase family protein [Sphingobacterium sp. dk4302]